MNYFYSQLFRKTTRNLGYYLAKLTQIAITFLGLKFIKLLIAIHESLENKLCRSLTKIHRLLSGV